MLKNWMPGFNPYEERFDKRGYWMLLPDFPIELWSKDVFISLANSVGRFLMVEDNCFRWNNKRLAWILVEIDPLLGFPEEIEVILGVNRFIQVVDFGEGARDRGATSQKKMSQFWRKMKLVF